MLAALRVSFVGPEPGMAAIGYADDGL